MRPKHVTWSTEGRLPFFPGEALRRRAVRKLVACGGAELGLYCIVDEHVHGLFNGPDVVVSRRIRACTRSLRQLAVIPLDAPRIRAINSRAHLENAVGYVLDQPEHHGLPEHSALWSGNCVADIVGARWIEGAELCTNLLLPRFRPSDALGAVGLPGWPLEPATLADVATVGAYGLVRAAASALCVALPLDSQLPHVVSAKRVACVLALEAGLALAGVAEAGGFSWRSARRLAAQPIPVQARRAVLPWLALEEGVRKFPRKRDKKQKR